MKHSALQITIVIITSAFIYACTANGGANRKMQIETAVLAAPEDKRDAATVLGYNGKGAVDTIRTGTNNLICLADNPEKEGFSCACYHKSLASFMKRGRDLRAEGKSQQEVRQIRGKEVKEGKLPLPKGATLYVLSGQYDESTGEIEDKYLRYVIYMPYATRESTGLPKRPVTKGGPWLMDAGTHRAHVMINPARLN